MPHRPAGSYATPLFDFILGPRVAKQLQSEEAERYKKLRKARLANFAPPPDLKNVTNGTSGANKPAIPVDGDDDTWTGEQDAELLRLKGENMPWKEIAVMTGRPQWKCKERYKEIQPKDQPQGQKQNNKGENKKESKQEKKQEKQQQQQEKKQQQHEQQQQNEGNLSKKERKRLAKEQWEAQQAENGQAEHVENGQAEQWDGGAVQDTGVEDPFRDPDFERTLYLEEDENFTTDDLEILGRLNIQDEDRKWNRLSTAFFHETGRRIPAAEIEAKFHGYATGY